MRKVMNFLKKNVVYIIFCIIFVVINFCLMKDTGSEYQVARKTKYIIFGIASIIEFIFLLIINKKKYPIEKMFLIIAIPIGLLYMTLLPIGQIPDENTHYARIYGITEGYIVGENDSTGAGFAYMPDYILNHFYNGNLSDYNYSNITDNLLKKYDNSKSKKFIYTNTSLYNFIVYIPQTIGVYIGKLLRLPPLLTVYLSRLFNFITYVLLIYFALKLIPFLKKTVMLISLLPIALQEGVSLAPDALTISLSLLLVSYILYLKYTYVGKIEKKQFIILTILSTICSLCKIVYMPIILLCLLLPKEKFKSKKDKYIKTGLLILICVVLNGAWTLFATRYLAELNPGVNSKEQIKYVLTQPFSYIMVMFRTARDSAMDLIYQMLGISLGLFNIYTYKIYPILSGLLLIILAIFNSLKGVIISKKDKIIYIFIPLAILLLINTSLYVQWTPVKNIVVDGIQGRYFIPLIIFLPLILMRTKEKKKINFDKNLDKYYYSFIVFQLINAVTMIVLVNI